MTRIIAVLTLSFLVAACGAVGGGNKSNVKRTGSDTDDYRKSPCACGPAITTPNYRQSNV
jgi:hypothetical protein